VAPRYAEYRLDAIFGTGTKAHAGAGVVFPMGTYVRLGLTGAAGVAWRAGASRESGRVDVIGRFLLDPFRELPVGFSLGGGLSMPLGEGTRARPQLAIVVDVEGRKRGPFSPAFQIGLGGGARVGIVLRGSATRWR